MLASSISFFRAVMSDSRTSTLRFKNAGELRISDVSAAAAAVFSPSVAAASSLVEEASSSAYSDDR